jgi:hypothetical protein
MKKFSFLPGIMLIAVVTAVMFISCQKEQNTSSTTAATAAASESNVVGVAGTATLAGAVPTVYAAALKANYAKKYGSADDQTQMVAFSAKDLVTFINSLQTKYKSDIIYVNFGVYGKGALPVQSKDYGRLTVFFTGNNIPGLTSGKKTDGTSDDGSDEFLNHGGLVP